MIDLDLIGRLLPLFVQGLGRTVQLVAVAFVLGVTLGFALHAARALTGGWVGRAVSGFVLVWRGTPFLAQLYLAYFGLPVLGLSLSPYAAAAGALTLYTAAYAAEIFRGCWATLPVGQAEAAATLGIPRWRAFAHLQAPQALRLSVPLLANQAILVLKESSLASLITYPELSLAASKVVAEQFVYVEPYVLLALAYWGLSLLIQAAGRGARRLFAKEAATS